MSTRLTGLDHCRWLDLPKIADVRGNLTVIESAQTIPFEIKRIYYLYDIPAGATRAGHAHKELSQIFVALSGSFNILLNDGNESKEFQLNRPYQGLYVCPMIWRELSNFSSGSVCLVLASEFYSEEDYYRDYDTFIKATHS